MADLPPQFPSSDEDGSEDSEEVFDPEQLGPDGMQAFMDSPDLGDGDDVEGDDSDGVSVFSGDNDDDGAPGDPVDPDQLP